MFPILASVSILYPMKTPEILWFSGVFRGYKMGILTRNWFKAGITLAILGDSWKTPTKRCFETLILQKFHFDVYSMCCKGTNFIGFTAKFVKFLIIRLLD